VHALEQSAAEAQRSLQAVAAERDAANAACSQAEDRAAKLQLEILVSREHFESPQRSWISWLFKV